MSKLLSCFFYKLSRNSYYIVFTYCSRIMIVILKLFLMNKIDNEKRKYYLNKPTDYIILLFLMQY